MGISGRIFHRDEIERPLKMAEIKKWENGEKGAERSIVAKALHNEGKSPNYEVGRDDMNNYLRKTEQHQEDLRIKMEQEQTINIAQPFNRHVDPKGVTVPKEPETREERMTRLKLMIDDDNKTIHWRNHPPELDRESLQNITMNSEDAYDVKNLNDEISELCNHNLTKPTILQGILEPLVCEQMLKTYDYLLNNLDETLPQVETDKLIVPVWSGVLMNSGGEIFEKYGKIINSVIQALMAEVSKFNEEHKITIKGVWDVPRFISMEQGQGGAWHNDLGIGAAEHLQQVTIQGEDSKEGDWNGMPPPSTRKISTLLCMSDGGSYDGGDIELLCDEVKTMRLNVGDCIMWPSFIPTRFLPVTRGKLVCFKFYSNGKAYV